MHFYGKDAYTHAAWSRTLSPDLRLALESGNGKGPRDPTWALVAVKGFPWTKLKTFYLDTAHD
jgi:hypothetical protein